MIISKDMMKQIEGKLRRPVHITYIARYILKMDEKSTREVLNTLIDMGVIEEYKHSKDYYGLKSSNE